MSEQARAQAAARAAPLHLPGAILPHGAMLVCDPVSLELRHWSSNFTKLTKYPGDPFPGQQVFDILGRQLVHDLRNACAAAGGRIGAGMLTGVRLAWSESRFDVQMHSHAGATFIELEPSPAQVMGPERALDLTRQLVGRLSLATDTERLLTTGARLVQALLGFDRVMVCRVQPDGSGRVVAEARMPTLDSLMGHHVPAGEIASQARALLQANAVRAIPDVAGRPVPLEPLPDPAAPPLDMTHAQLRGVSPVLCGCLRAKGVRGVFSISLTVEGELWGIVACHHPVARAVPPVLRGAADLFGQYFALQIAAADQRDARAARTGARAELDRLMQGLGVDAPLADSIAERLPRLAALAGCDGAALCREDRWAATAAAPPEAGCRCLLEMAQAAGQPIWHQSDIAAMVPDANGIAGALVIRLSATTDDAVLLFRKADGPPGRAEWSAHDLDIAEAARSRLRDALLTETEAMARERAETGHRRAVLNEELNHRVKNVLSLVKSIAAQTAGSAGSVAEYSAALDGRLHALASAHDTTLGSGGGSLAALIEAEAVLHRSARVPDRVVARGPDLMLGDKGYGVLALVIHEMMTNAVKYGALSLPDGRLAISWTHDPVDGLVIGWHETGGPPVVAPSRLGFGSRLIRSSVEYDLRGRAEIDFAPGGMVARLVVPAHHATLPDDGRGDAPSPAEPARISLAGWSVLVVEDQGLIAMDTEETLRHLGARDIRLAASGPQALEVLAGFRPDLAVLDVNLGGETSEMVAQALIARRSPFIFMTGYSDQVMLPPQFRNFPVVRKPVSAAAIALNVAAAHEAVRKG